MKLHMENLSLKKGYLKTNEYTLLNVSYNKSTSDLTEGNTRQCLESGKFVPVAYPARIAENLFKMAAYSGKFIQDGGGMLTSSIRRAHGVRTKVGRLRKHSVLKSDWFSVKLVILTCSLMQKEQVMYKINNTDTVYSVSIYLLY